MHFDTRDMRQLTSTVLCHVSKLATLAATLSTVGLEKDILSKNLEVWLVGRQSEHDEIGVLLCVQVS